MTALAKARSKRSRAAPCNWASRLHVLNPTTSSSEPDKVVPGQKSLAGKKPVKTTKLKKKDGGEASSEGRKCLHCATDKTSEWRTGPMGAKTLCNACGVRYRSGQLVPEYRPTASLTFVLTNHSNSHRKVLELRREKEMARAQQQQQQLMHHRHQNTLFVYFIHQPLPHLM
ncbi:GATA transcription factor 12-like [Hibiscus syriacus]|uniref:GATA transcription factor 12-like n=1 Tax=Hibiscus syriacus TaxID=106335 RepID=UPI001920FCF5|nr:GATA transcription factor 12-like [Hibiscus syriacus]